MNKNASWLLPKGPIAVSAITLALLLTLSAAPVKAQESRVRDTDAIAAGTIEGTLVAPLGSGKAVAGVQVSIVEIGASATLDQHGKFTFANVAPGTYTLVAIGDGFSRLRITDVVVKPNTAITLSPEIMPAILGKDGEVMTMEEVVVSAKKGVETMEEMVVTDTKPPPFSDRNVDLPRGVDDVQPYYIFNSQTIEESGAANVQDFLKRRLSMNTESQSPSETPNNGTRSEINLRGLGADQTLILVDGRRMAGVEIQGGEFQPDLDGIPLAAIDRIEVLPSSASAIYGGSAVGGVVNVILKKNYSGGEIKVTYDNTWDTDAPLRTLEATYGLSLEGGRTHLMITAQFSDSKPLLEQDRLNVFSRGLNWALAHSPSFVYSAGNPFLGASPNITSADYDQNGNISNLTLLNGTPLNSPITYIPAGTSPTTSAATLGAGLLRNAGRYDLQLPPTADAGTGLDQSLGAAAKTKALMATLRRQMTPKLELFAEFSNESNSSLGLESPFEAYYFVPAGTPTNPFAQDVYMTFPDTQAPRPFVADSISRALTIGATAKLPWGWTGELDYTWSENTFSKTSVDADNGQLNNDIADGTVNPFVDALQYPLDLSPYLSLPYEVPNRSTLNDLALRLSGPVARLPWSSAILLTAGLEHRKEGSGDTVFSTSYPNDPAADSAGIYFGQSESTDSAYAEADVPLVAPKQALRFVNSLDLQFAGRGERYSVGTGTESFYIEPNETPPFSYWTPSAPPGGVPYRSHTAYTSTNPTLGLKWKPGGDFIVRASYATAFLPPTNGQLLPNVTPDPSPQPITDPANGQTYNVETLSGGNPALKPQTSRSWDAGLIWEPAAGIAKGVRVDLEFYEIAQYNVIGSLTPQQVVDSPDQTARVTRDPTTGRVSLVNVSLENLTEYRTDGWDLTVDYRRDTPVGTFDLYAMGTVIEHDRREIDPGSPLVDYVGYADDGGESKTKGNVSLTWEYRQWSAGWSAEYYGAYNESGAPGGPNGAGSTYYTDAQGGTTVASQIYHNVFWGYSFGKGRSGRAARLLDGLSVQAGVKNVFRALPPIDVYYEYYGYFSPYGDIRLRTYQLTVRKQF